MFETGRDVFCDGSTSGKMPPPRYRGIASGHGISSDNQQIAGGNCFVPWVLSLSGVPEITDEERAKEDPELAVLSAMAHARDPDPAKSARPPAGRC